MSESKPRICIVDDDVTSANLLAMELEDYYRTSIANSGKEAVTTVREVKPDLVLLDVMLPDIDGYEVCEMLKADMHTAAIPIIFITGLEDSRSEEEGLALGADDFLTKPINSSVVRARVDRVLQSALYCEFLERLVCQKDETIESLRIAAQQLLAQNA